jgi:hypothetical protein
VALDGGTVTLPGPKETTMPGLRSRLAAAQLTDQVQIVHADVLQLKDIEPADAAWTSCSWHYSMNHHRPLADFIDSMSRLCKSPGGVFGAEFMMPIQPRHFDIEHYLEAGEIRRYLPGWDIMWETYTPPFVEAPHIGQLDEHVHRMGLVIARRP